MLEHDRPVVLIAEPGRETEAATRLGRIGFDNVAGYLAGGMQALEHEPALLERLHAHHRRLPSPSSSRTPTRR